MRLLVTGAGTKPLVSFPSVVVALRATIPSGNHRLVALRVALAKAVIGVPRAASERALKPVVRHRLAEDEVGLRHFVLLAARKIKKKSLHTCARTRLNRTIHVWRRPVCIHARILRTS